MRGSVGFARVLLVASFASTVVFAKVQAADVSVQIVNPEEGALVRVFLDRQLIYEGMPDKASLGVHRVLSMVAGKFTLNDKERHVLVAEAPTTHTKSKFEWNPQRDPSPWIVIRYYPGRSEPAEPPFFTFSLQELAFKLK